MARLAWLVALCAGCAGCAGTRTEVVVSYYHQDAEVSVRVSK